MANPLRAATIIPAPSGSTSRAQLAQMRGPQIPHYAVCEDTGDLYRWIVADTTDADDFNVLTASGGTEGRWHRVVADRHGADLDDSDETIVIADGMWRVLPTMARNCVKTLSADGAKPGDEIEIVRISNGAFTLTVMNAVAEPDEQIAFSDSGLPVTLRFRFRSAAAGWYQSFPGTL